MQYYRLQYIVKVLLLNGLFVLFSHSMEKDCIQTIYLTSVENSSINLTNNNTQRKLYTTIDPKLFYYKDKKGIPRYLWIVESDSSKDLYETFTILNNNKKELFFQKIPSQETKTKKQKINNRNLNDLQKPYIFQCKICGTKIENISRYNLLNRAKQHLNTKHKSRYFTIKSKIKYIKGHIQYPDEIILFTIQCPAACTVACHSVERLILLKNKLMTHLKETGNNFSDRFIRDYIEKNVEFSLIPNPYKKANLGKKRKPLCIKNSTSLSYPVKFKR